MRRRFSDKDNLVLVVSGTDIVSIVPWKKAIMMVLDGSAQIIEHNGKVIRSQYETYPFPEVVMQLRTLPPRLIKPPACRLTVLERDNYTCQYKGCSNPTPKHSLLDMDHVIPKSKGGPKVFTNLVTSCIPCNRKKRNRTPEEAGMSLIAPPQDLKPMTLAARLKMKADRDIKPSWRKYIEAFS